MQSKEKKKKVTFNDIADHTGFSKTTISRYFNNPDSLTAKNQEIIRKALADLNYHENKVARILAKGKTEFVGIIVPNLYLHYFSELLNQILITHNEFGFKYLVFVGDGDPEHEKKYLAELMSYQIEGLIVMSHTLPSDELASLGIPVVSVEREDDFISSVNCDNYAGARQAAALLHRHECDVYIHVNTPTPETIPAYKRILGFRDYCRENSLRHEIIFLDGDVSFTAISPAVEKLLERIETQYPGQKKGLFFSDDTRAHSFLNHLVRKYNSLPDSYRLVGFDNSPISRESIYPISTVDQQIPLIAHEAVTMLVSLIDEAKKGTARSLSSIRHKTVPTVLYQRDTTEFYASGKS